MITFVTTSGFGGNPTGANAFIGPTVNVTLAAGQRAHMVIEKALGAGATAATNLNIYACYQNTGGGALTTQGAGIFGLTAAVNERKEFGINWVFSGLLAGTYTVGMCGSSTNAVNWTNNEWGYISALVF